MHITVTKHTGLEELRRAASTTIHKDSNLTLARCYAMEHSPMRTQVFTVELRQIPQHVANQLVRHKIGCEWFMQSKRVDRGGENFEYACGALACRVKEINTLAQMESISGDIIDLPKRFDRNAPTNLTGFLNAEAFINISKKRLCHKASPATQEVWLAVVDELAYVDPDLARLCVPQCVYRGGICPEPQSCGWCKTDIFQKQLEQYRKLIMP